MCQKYLANRIGAQLFISRAAFRACPDFRLADKPFGTPGRHFLQGRFPVPIVTFPRSRLLARVVESLFRGITSG